LAGYIPRWFTRSHTVTHPSINRARRRVTSLIETNALPLSHATNHCRFILDLFAVQLASALMCVEWALTSVSPLWETIIAAP